MLTHRIFNKGIINKNYWWRIKEKIQKNLQGRRVTRRQRAYRGSIYLANKPCHILGEGGNYTSES